MAYEKVFEPSYPNGWKNRPDTSTPAYAETFDGYDQAIEHIEDHLDGTTAIFPIQATGGMTQPVGIDENGRLVTMPTGGGGGGTASEITYDNTESELESTDVQGAIDELAAGAGEKVTPVPKTEDMTQEVGIDENGELWTIPVGGGSGISGLTKLWEYANSPAGMVSGTMELSDDYTNYDFLIFSSARSNGSLQGNGIISIEDLDISKTLTAKMITVPGAVGSYGAFTVTDSTHFAITSVSTDYGFRAIYGYKAVSGGDSVFDETVILDTPVQATVSTPITLDEAITNYDQIRIRSYMSFNGMKLWSDNLFQSDDFILGDTTDQHWIFIDSNDLCYFSMSSDGTQLVIASVAGSVYIGEVVGIKYDSGAENTWTKLLDVRDETSQTASSYTLSDSILNYSEVLVKGYYVYQGRTVVYGGTFNVDSDLVDSANYFYQVGAVSCLAFSFNSDGTVINQEPSSASNYIYQVLAR